MVDQMLAAHVAFKKLQKEASEVGLTLEFDGGRFVLSAEESRMVKDRSGNIIDISQIDVSSCPHDTIRACIMTWAFCRDYHEYDKKHQAPTVD